MTRLGTALLGASLLLWPVAAHAYAGSDDDQKACTDDVFRLCTSAIPDETRIVACLASKKAELSPACAQVFADPPPRQSRRKARRERTERQER